MQRNHTIVDQQIREKIIELTSDNTKPAIPIDTNKLFSNITLQPPIGSQDQYANSELIKVQAKCFIESLKKNLITSARNIWDSYSQIFNTIFKWDNAIENGKVVELPYQVNRKCLERILTTALRKKLYTIISSLDDLDSYLNCFDKQNNKIAWQTACEDIMDSKYLPMLCKFNFIEYYESFNDKDKQIKLKFIIELLVNIINTSPYNSFVIEINNKAKAFFSFLLRDQSEQYRLDFAKHWISNLKQKNQKIIFQNLCNVSLSLDRKNKSKPSIKEKESKKHKGEFSFPLTQSIFSPKDLSHHQTKSSKATAGHAPDESIDDSPLIQSLINRELGPSSEVQQTFSQLILELGLDLISTEPLEAKSIDNELNLTSARQ